MKEKYFSNNEKPFSEQEFKELLEQIENGNFTSNNLLITCKDYEQMLPQGAVDLNDDKTILLANALKKNPNITKLDLTHNNIGDVGASALASVNTLEELKLWGNNIGTIGATALAYGNLSKLDLGENFIIYKKTPLEIAPMINAFAANNTITDLQLYNCQVPDEMIAKVIKNNKTLKKLDLGYCNLNDDSLKYIKDNTTLENLYLYGNNITDLGAQYISQNHNLIDVDFGTNSNFTEIAARFLSTHPTLKSVSLNSAYITMEELKEIFSKENIDISFLDDTNLSGNIDDNIDCF